MYYKIRFQVTVFGFECHNVKCRFEVINTHSLIFQKVYMWCPCEWHVHTYIHCSVSWSWSPVWFIHLSLTHIWMIIYWTCYPFWTPIITKLPLLMKLIFIISKHSLFLVIYLCTWNTVMFLWKYMLISPCSVLKIYSWACMKSCFF